MNLQLHKFLQLLLVRLFILTQKSDTKFKKVWAWHLIYIAALGTLWFAQRFILFLFS